MASASNENVQEYIEQVAKEEYFDWDIFTSLRCSRRYDKQLCKIMIKEKGIILTDLEGWWPAFHGRLVSSGWICFVEEPRKANHEVIREFYANAVETDFKNDLVVTVRGNQVHFDPELINAYYNLPNNDNRVYLDRAKDLDTQWFVDHLHGGKMPNWIRNHLRIESSEFTTEAKTWLSIICARVMPYQNETEVTLEKARVICAIIEGTPVNMGQLIIDEIAEVVAERTKSLLFSSLITHLCYEARVEKRPTDKEKNPEKLIHPLLRKGARNAQKKRKIDVASPSFGQFPDTITEMLDSPVDAIGTCTAIVPLEQGPLTLSYISHQVYVMETQVRQLIAGLPSGPSGESTFAGPPGQGKVPSSTDLAKEQQAIKAKLGMIERRQLKQREYEKRKNKFLTKMMSTLRKFCG